MKKLKIIEFGNPILRQKAKKVPLAYIGTPKCQALIKNLIYTMREGQGVGIAAPQVGESIQLVIAEMRGTPTRPNHKPKGPAVLINPIIKEYSKETFLDYEGCLSIFGFFAKVPRSKRIVVEYYNENGDKVVEEATGNWARIYQHEIDHLSGVSFIDRVKDTKTFVTLEEYKKLMNKKPKTK